MVPLRRPRATSVVLLVGLVAGTACTHWLAPKWSRRVGLDVWNVAEAESDLRQTTDRHDEIVAKGDRSAWRRVLADQYAARLVTGDADLAGTAVLLLDLFRDEPWRQSVLEMWHPTVSDPRLLYARHAIGRAERLVREGAPDRCEAVFARLEAEYRELARVWTAPPQAPPTPRPQAAPDPNPGGSHRAARSRP